MIAMPIFPINEAEARQIALDHLKKNGVEDDYILSVAYWRGDWIVRFAKSHTRIHIRADNGKIHKTSHIRETLH